MGICNKHIETPSVFLNEIVRVNLFSAASHRSVGLLGDTRGVMSKQKSKQKRLDFGRNGGGGGGDDDNNGEEEEEEDYTRKRKRKKKKTNGCECNDV